MKRFRAENAAPAEKSAATQPRRDPLTAMLLPSFMGILLCLFLLCGATWAWFSATETCKITPMQSADYRITIEVKAGNTVIETADDIFAAVADTEYTVSLTASGTASTGFCEVLLPGAGEEGEPATTTLYTAQIGSGESLSFTIRLSSAQTVTFLPQWGTSYKSEAPDITDGTAVTNGN